MTAEISRSDVEAARPRPLGTEPPASDVESPAYCTRCGRPPAEGDHASCQRWLASEEPPRYCSACGRRMKVQVVPVGWAAECSRHGRISGGSWT